MGISCTFPRELLIELMNSCLLPQKWLLIVFVCRFVQLLTLQSYVGIHILIGELPCIQLCVGDYVIACACRCYENYIGI